MINSTGSRATRVLGVAALVFLGLTLAFGLVFSLSLIHI